jgi:hypothetical protein
MKVRKVEVRETPKGKGVFAVYNIQKDQVVMAYGGVAVSTEAMMVAVQRGDNVWWKDYAKQISAEHALVPRDPGDFGGHLVNHSCDPSAAYRKDLIVATRGIRKGEEVTCCYGWVSKKEEHACLCEAEVCAGILGVGIVRVEAEAEEARLRVRSETVGAVLAAALLNGRKDVYDQYERDLLEAYGEAGATSAWLGACAAWATGMMKARGGGERRVMTVLRVVDGGTPSGPTRPADLLW